LLIVTTAVVIAVVTPAVASPTKESAITPSDVRRIAKAVADAEIARLAPGLSVRSAATANSTAMYAQIASGGAVTTNSMGIVQGSVVHPEPGFYCFTKLRNAPKGGVATIDTNVAGGGSGGDLVQVGVGTIRRCPAGTQAFVAIFKTEGGFVDDPFFVVFWF
jgi:hypothetical protein